MKLSKKYKYEIFLFLVIAIFAISVYLLRSNLGFLSERESLEEFIKSFGTLAPLAIIILIVLEVIIAPLPGFIPALSAGFIFGTIEGAFYTLIGNIIGTTLAFIISRKLGRPMVIKFINEDRLNKYESMISRRESILFALYFFPIFPIDILSFAFGLSEVKFKKFIIIASIGLFFNVLIINFFGDTLAQLYFNGQ